MRSNMSLPNVIVCCCGPSVWSLTSSAGVGSFEAAGVGSSGSSLAMLSCESEAFCLEVCARAGSCCSWGGQHVTRVSSVSSSCVLFRSLEASVMLVFVSYSRVELSERAKMKLDYRNSTKTSWKTNENRWRSDDMRNVYQRFMQLLSPSSRLKLRISISWDFVT